jgi:hypothetical protein
MPQLHLPVTRFLWGWAVAIWYQRGDVIAKSFEDASRVRVGRALMLGLSYVLNAFVIYF